MTFVQRFGGALNLHPHFHVLMQDGVYAGSEEGTAPDKAACFYYPLSGSRRARLLARDSPPFCLEASAHRHRRAAFRGLDDGQADGDLANSFLGARADANQIDVRQLRQHPGVQGPEPAESNDARS